MSATTQDVNAGEIFKESSIVKIDEGSRLTFAKQILFFLFLICTGVFVAFSCYPDNKALASIFELIKIGALPLITFVISFYFPNAK